ncbi:probable serine/threonine-protein kinase SIS8 [Cornus florida]|uniref:probable serine/threonine-protein kinase SIS8 n=1 Tax=Cornus florida TaxID=4283 RepID=UPI0028970C86|nr:probable serine/threonine-protein kinase SIS8 [Cornus florida]
MSKMKHLFRKLHIGGGFQDNHRLSPTDENRPVVNPPQPQTTSLPSPSLASSSSPSAAFETTRVSDSAENSVDFNFFEEEFQVQLALAISVSDPDAREDAETAQIKAAKQISLGFSPSETLVESIRYWSYNFVNYDEKVMDGFYDVYCITPNSVAQGKMPMLVDLQAVSVSDNIDYEVILVNRAIDPELRQLEERVCSIHLECQVLEQRPNMNSLIQKIADLVVDRMGGPVSDAEEMMKRWNKRSNELRNFLNTIIIPLGCLDVGLSRHRALLFKVLADRINLPCMLVKGSYYTGTDEGAVNLIKIDNGSEYIIDLMGAPGTLIPAEVPSGHLQNSGLDMRTIADIAGTVKHSCPVLEKGTGTAPVSYDIDGVTKIGSSNLEASFAGVRLKGVDGNLLQKNQTERFEHDFGKLLPSLRGSHESLSGATGKSSAAQKMKVKDVSNYIITASKNPEFAQKLHAVLLESGASPPPDLFLDMNPQDLREQKVLEKINLLNGEKLDDGTQYYPEMFLSKQSFIPSIGAQSFDNAYCDSNQKNYLGESAAQLELRSSVINSGHSLPSDLTSEGFVLVSSGANELIQTGDMSEGVVSVDSSGMVARALHGKQSNDTSMLSGANYYEGKPKNALADDGECYHKDKIGKVINNIGKDKESGVRLTDMANLGEVAEWEIPWDDLQIGERIGIGSYGEVYRADWNSTEVAVKKFMDQDISGDALVQFKCEVEIMLRLRHPNVVLFMGAVTRPPNLSILTEFLPRGSLFKLLHRPNILLDEKRRMRMALDVAKGMNYLHTSHPIIVHRDLKTPNLLVDKNWVVKVCDFGLSRMQHHTFLSSKSTAGTPEWMAPEVLRNEPSNEKSDVYSFGVILWELVTLQIPWTGMNSMQVVGAVGFQNRHLDIPEMVDPMVAEIITECWHLDPSCRPSFGQLITRLKRLQRLQRLVERT